MSEEVVITKEELDKLYTIEGFSTREIAELKKTTKGKIEHLLEKNNIPRRTVSEALKITALKQKNILADEAKVMIEESIKNTPLPKMKYNRLNRRNLLVPIPIDPNASRDAVVTIVLSDLHLGDADHLPDTYWSTIDNIVETLKNINGFYAIKEVYVVFNGDVVSGRDVFKFQELRNLIQRGHWQVFLAEIVIKDTLEKLGQFKAVDNIFFVRGTHEALASNFILYIKRMLGENTRYLSHGGLVNIAGSLGKYNVLFTHGYGSADVFPVPSGLIKDCLKYINETKNMGIQIDRVCSGHSHWLSTGLVMDDIYWDVTGGFQKWELTLSQRPAGAVVYLYNNGEVSSMGVRPDNIVERTERHDVGLEYKNLIYYGKMLLKHLKEIEKQ